MRLRWGVATILYGPTHLGNNLVFCLDVQIHSILTPFPPPKVGEGGLKDSMIVIFGHCESHYGLHFI